MSNPLGSVGRFEVYSDMPVRTDSSSLDMEDLPTFFLGGGVKLALVNLEYSMVNQILNIEIQ